MASYIITYRFKTVDGKERGIYYKFREWIEENDEEIGECGELDDTTSTAFYSAEDGFDIVGKIRELYQESQSNIEKDDTITIVELEDDGTYIIGLNAIIQLSNGKWKESYTIKEFITSCVEDDEEEEYGTP